MSWAPSPCRGRCWCEGATPEPPSSSSSKCFPGPRHPEAGSLAVSRPTFPAWLRVKDLVRARPLGNSRGYVKPKEATAWAGLSEALTIPSSGLRAWWEDIPCRLCAAGHLRSLICSRGARLGSKGVGGPDQGPACGAGAVVSVPAGLPPPGAQSDQSDTPAFNAFGFRSGRAVTASVEAAWCGRQMGIVAGCACGSGLRCLAVTGSRFGLQTRCQEELDPSFPGAHLSSGEGS